MRNLFTNRYKGRVKKVKCTFRNKRFKLMLQKKKMYIATRHAWSKSIYIVKLTRLMLIMLGYWGRLRRICMHALSKRTSEIAKALFMCLIIKTRFCFMSLKPERTWYDAAVYFYCHFIKNQLIKFSRFFDKKSWFLKFYIKV